MPFEDSLLKKHVREVEDITHIQKFHSDVSPSIRRKFRYLGLPGKRVLDLEAWSAYLGEITAVEQEKDYIAEIYARAKKLGFLDRLQVMEDKIEDLLVEGEDAAGRSPKFPYDIVNLDFEGGLLMKDSVGRSRKVDGLKALFDRQGYQAARNATLPLANFLLFLSIGERENPETEYEEWWASLLRANDGRVAQRLVKWREALPSEFFLRKPHITDMVRRIAEDRHFDCKSLGAYTYLGHSDIRMLRFAFRCRFVSRIDIALAHSQSFAEAFSLPLCELVAGGASVKTVEHPSVFSDIVSPA